SGGEQQMLAIARALIGVPDLLLLDEPSMGLAPIITEQIFDVIRDINRKGVTVILVEQNAGLALKMARQAIILESGEIIRNANATELLEDDSVKKAYLGI
ncbi:MAG: ATP-binding cassette domain-containing protein, partial [Burkholderiaceae bacterium]